MYYYFKLSEKLNHEKIEGVREMKCRSLVLIFLIILSLSLASCSSGTGPASHENEMIAFNIVNVSPPATGVINQSEHSIAITVPYDTDVTHLIATFTVSDGATVYVNHNYSTVQQSGITTNDFTNPVVYTVWSAGNYLQDYTVTVTGASASNYAGTQSPGDFWSWTIDRGAGTFSAINNTKSFNYSGTLSALAGNPGISKLSVTSTTETGLTPPQSAYMIEVVNTALLVAHAPIYTTPSGTQQSIKPPIFATAQGSCPSTGVNVNWIAMPSANWCSAAGDPNPLVNGGAGCTNGDNAFGTAAISVSGSTYGITVTSYRLDGTADPSGPFILSGCSCSNGLIQCTDSGSHPVRISFTPSGVFFVDMPNDALAGIVQPSSNIDLSDFLKSGRIFKAIYHTALDSSQIFNTQTDCTSHGGVWIGGTCGTHATQPASVTTDGTHLTGHPYSDIDNGTLSSQGGTISFATSSQRKAPGLITGTFTDFGGGSSPIVMAVRQVNNKYIALIITHSPNATLGGGFNVLAVEQ
jgi:hypothetical protein